MKVAPQKTLAREGSISGKGLHTGENAVLTLKPAPLDTGLRFFKRGRPLRPFSGGTASSESLRCSAVGEGDERVLTVEHLLAALTGLGITNLDIDVDGPEVPGLDGSALAFVKLVLELGVAEQGKAADFYRIREPIFCYDKAKAIAIYPSDSFRVSYRLDYEHPHLRDQKVEFELTPEAFERQIAPARTFCTEREASELRTHGLGLGAGPENTLVVAENGSHRSGMRFEDEPARHKVLDILGDLGLLGFPVLGHVVAVRSGHALNRRLAEAIRAQRGSMNSGSKRTQAMLMGPEEIKKILPHREPFLFVDKIVEMSDKRIVGIRQVTGKEDFFRGHFPQRPVMPGVLMVEALAQTGGVLMLSKPEHQGKIAYLASVSQARFRRVVSPGDELTLEVEVLKFKSRVGIVKGVARVGAETACEAEIMFSLAD